MKNRNIVVLSIATFIAAAAGIYMLLKKRNGEEAPPKGAPQLGINNPGEQSEFLTLPSEESELG